MVSLLKPRTAAVLALLLVAGCDSTSPPGSGLLRVQGEVLEVGQAPAPALDVHIQAWPDLGADGSDTVTVQTDATGRYAADLGPFPNSVIDSLRVQVTQNDCGLQLHTELRRRDLPPDDGVALALPTLALSYRLRPGELSFPGGAVCGAIVTPFTAQAVGDYARLALWFDEQSDSVRGRWRLNHQATSADDYGYFSGTLGSDRLSLDLRPTQPTSCTGLHLEIPVGGDNGSTLGVSDLTGDGSCFVPSKPVRFFEGAVLSEVLPP